MTVRNIQIVPKYNMHSSLLHNKLFSFISLSAVFRRVIRNFLFSLCCFQLH